MELAEARAAAQDVLDGMASAAVPLRLVEDALVADVGWAWVFGWNTARWFSTRDPADAIGPGSGPIAVRRDGTAAFVLGSAPSFDEQLAAYAAAHDLPPPAPLGW